MTVCYWCGAKDTLADIGKELDDGKYKMVQCSKCKNAYYVVNKEKMNKPKPMTNEEWLCDYFNNDFRAMPTEKKAEVIADFIERLYSLNCSKLAWMMWLKEKHDELL